MTTELLHRIRKEFTVSLTTLREIVFALSERVNRKVQVLQLHWRASQLKQDLDRCYQELGAQIASWVTPGSSPSAGTLAERNQTVQSVNSRVWVLKKERAKVESLIRELDAESMGETLQAVQRDLTVRGVAIERIMVAARSAAIGHSITQMEIDPAVRVVAVLRGPIVLTPCETVVFRPGDIVLVVGPRAEINRLLPVWTDARRQSA